MVHLSLWFPSFLSAVSSLRKRWLYLVVRVSIFSCIRVCNTLSKASFEVARDPSLADKVRRSVDPRGGYTVRIPPAVLFDENKNRLLLTCATLG